MPKKKKRSTTTLRGKIISFNISPKGHIEGALLETSEGLAQVNFPKHVTDSTREMRMGHNVDLEVKRRGAAGGEHPIYTLRDTASPVIGTIVRFNYAKHGEVNGYHLDEGTFVHTDRQRAEKYRLRIGEQVKALGSRRLGDAAVLRVSSLEKVRGGSIQRGEGVGNGVTDAFLPAGEAE